MTARAPYPQPQAPSKAETPCSRCSGTGRVPGFENRDALMRRQFDRYSVLCDDCGGSGKVRQ